MKTIRRIIALAAAVLLLAHVCAGFAETKEEKRDNRDRVTEITWKDDHGNPVAGPNGYAVIRYAYQGQKTTETYFDASGNPYKMPGGYYGRAVTLGNKNRISQIEYLGSDGRLTMTEM